MKRTGRLLKLSLPSGTGVNRGVELRTPTLDAFYFIILTYHTIYCILMTSSGDPSGPPFLKQAIIVYNKTRIFIRNGRRIKQTAKSL